MSALTTSRAIESLFRRAARRNPQTAVRSPLGVMSTAEVCADSELIFRWNFIMLYRKDHAACAVMDRPHPRTWKKSRAACSTI